MSLLKKCLFALGLFSIVLNPFEVEARPDRIKPDDIEGTYQFSGFSNSLGNPLILESQSQAVVGQLKFYNDNTGKIKFVDLSIVINNQIVHVHREDVPFTYSLGPIDGYATTTIKDFPFPGQNPTFALSLKKHKGKVTGFSQINLEANNLTSRPNSNWVLVQGERFN